MTYVVNESCIRCKTMDCVEVCPVDCFHEGPNFLVIDPDECIDCTLCEPECPVEAIYSEPNTPSQFASYIQLNVERAAALKAAGGDAHLTEKVAAKEGPSCKKK